MLIKNKNNNKINKILFFINTAEFLFYSMNYNNVGLSKQGKIKFIKNIV